MINKANKHGVQNGLHKEATHIESSFEAAYYMPIPSWLTAVVQQAKALGTYCYVADSIPAGTPRQCINTIGMLLADKKKYPFKNKIS
jgi:hypothetical protein